MIPTVKPILFVASFTTVTLLAGASLASPYTMSNGYNNRYTAPANQYNTRGSMRPAYQAGQGLPQIISVTTTNTGTSIVIGGTVVPLREVTLSAQVPGRIEYLAGIEGDWFEPGQVMATIDSDDLQAKRRQAVANISGQTSALQNAQVQYSREFWSPQSRSINKMPGMGMPSMFDTFFTRPFGSAMGLGNPLLDRQADLYSQNSQLSLARSQQIGAISQLQEVDAKLRDTKAIAPFDGVIVKKLVEVGDTVQPGQPLYKFADARSLQVQVEVPARLMSGIKMDMVVPAVLDVGNTRINVRVAQIYPMANSRRHTVTVKFDLPDGVPAGPGTYAEVMIPDVNAPVNVLPVIPKSAVIWRGSLPAVFVHNNENKAELRLLRLGSAVDNSSVSVLSGLRAGERIYTQPSPGMASGWQSGTRQQSSQQKQ